jgi:hypothetical protein
LLKPLEDSPDLQAMKKESSLKVNSEANKDELRPYKKLEDYHLSRTDYKESMRENPHGTISQYK